MKTFKIEQDKTQCIVTWRHLNFIVVILLLFFVGWTAGCATLVYALLVKQELFVFLFALPFWAFWCGLFAWVAHILFGKTRFVLDEDGLETVYTCLFIKLENWFDLDDIRRFETKVFESRKGNRSYSLRIVLQGSDTSYSMPAGEDALNRLCKQLNAFLDHLAGTPGTAECRLNKEVLAKHELPEPMVFALDSPLQHLAPPPNSRWQYQADSDGFEFRFQDKGKFATLFRDIFGAICWNGLVWVIALLFWYRPPQKGGDSWLDFVFFDLMPSMIFGVNMFWLVFLIVVVLCLIGLVLIGVAMNTFLELFRRASCRFVYGGAITSTARLGPTQIEQYELTGWRSLVVRSVHGGWFVFGPNRKAGETDEAYNWRFYEEGKLWQLAFLDADDEELLVIKKLSKPEALWMADVVLREQRMVR